MKIILFLFLLLFVTGRLFCQDPLQRTDSLLKTYYKDDEPGIAIAIRVHGTTIYKKGIGLSNTETKEKISSSTNFNIGSMTKQFTAFSILKMVEQKRLSLDDKIITFFPGFNKKIGTTVSIRQLLTHSSGIIDHYATTDTSVNKHATDKDVLEAVKNIDHTYFTPGSQYRYSNTAYCLLGLVIEKLSGMAYNDYIRQHIFTPLSMQHSTVLKIGAPVYQKSTGYDYDSVSRKFRRLDANEAIFFSTEADGGIYTSIDDYLKWFGSLQKPLPEDKLLVENTRSPHFTVDANKKLSYGYGWFVSEKDSAKAVYHSGSNGGFRAFSFSIPSQDYLVVILSNRSDVDLENVLEEINKIFNISNKSFTKIESLVSCIDTWPIFAPCKETPLFLTSSKKSWNASGMALN